MLLIEGPGTVLQCIKDNICRIVFTILEYLACVSTILKICRLSNNTHYNQNKQSEDSHYAVITDVCALIRHKIIGNCSKNEEELKDVSELEDEMMKEDNTGDSGKFDDSKKFIGVNAVKKRQLKACHQESVVEDIDKIYVTRFGRISKPHKRFKI